MANDTWAEIRAAARLYARDTSSTNPGVSDAQMLIIVNRRGRGYYSRFEPRVIQHTGSQTGLTVSSNGVTATTTPVNYARIISLHRETSNSVTDGVQLKILPTVDELLNERTRLLGGGNAAPESVAVVRAQTTTPGSQGKWKMLLDKLSDSTYFFSGWFEVEYTDLVNTTDAPDLSPVGAADLAVLTAYDCALLLNRPDSFLNGIIQRAANIERVSEMLAADMAPQLTRRKSA